MLKTHTQAQLVAIEFAKAEVVADISVLKGLLDDGCILVSHLGVVYGKDNVLNVLADAKRHQYNKRHFSKFIQVQHCLDSSLRLFSAQNRVNHSPANDDFNQGSGSFLGSSTMAFDSETELSRTPFDKNGFDSQGFAQFERDGELSIDTRNGLRKVDLKETIVVNKMGHIVLLSRARRP